MSSNFEPWLRGTHTDVPPVQRAVVHALELAREDLDHWCATLTDEELNARPAGLGSIAFQLRHISGSIDRLLTYAESRRLDDRQQAALQSELESTSTRQQLFTELSSALTNAAARVCAFQTHDLDRPLPVGRKGAPTTVAGLLVHVADHTQRHVGEAIITCKIVMAQRT